MLPNAAGGNAAFCEFVSWNICNHTSPQFAQWMKRILSDFWMHHSCINSALQRAVAEASQVSLWGKSKHKQQQQWFANQIQFFPAIANPCAGCAVLWWGWLGTPVWSGLGVRCKSYLLQAFVFALLYKRSKSKGTIKRLSITGWMAWKCTSLWWRAKGGGCVIKVGHDLLTLKCS